MPPVALRFALALAFSAVATLAGAQCRGTVYLTFDTGHMEPASDIADILRKHDVKATFFLANEKTKRGDTVLDPAWAPFWKRLAEEGHAFGSHTWRHWYFRGDAGADRVSYAPPGAKQGETLDRDAVCAELRKPEEAFRRMTGRGFDGVWRAPGGKTTPRVLEFAKSCGFIHVGWSAAGFSGDELPADRYPSAKLIAKQLEDIRDGDVLLWHLGIWSRKDPLWPRLDELIAGLKAKGLCFARVTEGTTWKR
jgi:peptidoglycan/xylan/chitin deacetylase (PgdA/CDA1 family)